MHLSLALPTDVNLIDIGVDVTAVPVLNQGKISIAIAQLNAQANFPWWVYALAAENAMLAVVAANLAINNIVIPLLKLALVSVLQQAASNALQAQLSSQPLLAGLPIGQVQLEEGQMVVAYWLPSL